ncbi:hypothetical protein BHE74_00043479, partial [Ensete ventricosum]
CSNSSKLKLSGPNVPTNMTAVRLEVTLWLTSALSAVPPVQADGQEQVQRLGVATPYRHRRAGLRRPLLADAQTTKSEKEENN